MSVISTSTLILSPGLVIIIIIIIIIIITIDSGKSKL